MGRDSRVASEKTPLLSRERWNRDRETIWHGYSFYNSRIGSMRVAMTPGAHATAAGGILAVGVSESIGEKRSESGLAQADSAIVGGDNAIGPQDQRVLIGQGLHIFEEQLVLENTA